MKEVERMGGAAMKWVINNIKRYYDVAMIDASQRHPRWLIGAGDYEL